MNYNPLLLSLIEIFDGYTRFDFNGQTLFFKHFDLRDHAHLSFTFERYKNLALEKGIESESAILERLKNDNDWCEKDDLKIIELEEYLVNLKNSKRFLTIPSQRENHQKTIDENESELNFLFSKKKELIGICAEQYAEKMANEEFIRLLIYSDKSLKDVTFSETEFGELSSDEVYSLNRKYNIASKKFVDDNVQQIVLENFFNIYLSSCENPFIFFGKYIKDLSLYQMKLLLYGKMFSNIFQYNDDIPDHIKTNPKEIFTFLDSKKNKEKFQSQNGDSEATMVFGATKKDLEILDPNARKLSLTQMLQKNGGSLNMDQMMDLMGQ